MDVLQPYIDSGKLVVKSGQTAFEQVATPTGILRRHRTEWTPSSQAIT